MSLDTYFRYLRSCEQPEPKEPDESHVSGLFIAAGICALIALLALVPHLEVLL